MNESRATNYKFCSGFTLLEVMVALVIIAAGMISIVAIRNNCISEVTLAREFDIARMLAEEKLLEYESAGDIRMVPLSGSFYDHEGFSWVAEVTEEQFVSSAKDLPDAPLTYYKVSLDVYGPSSKGSLVRLVTIVRGPGDDGASEEDDDKEAPWDRKEQGGGEGQKEDGGGSEESSE